MAYNKSTKDRSNVVHCSHQSERKPPPGVPAPKGGLLYLVLTAREPSVKPLATATTAASGGNREELLGQRPAGCERQRQTLGAATRAPSCHIRIASAFIQKHKVTCLESRYKAVPVFSLLRHIGNAPVHWHEETFSSGGILLSDENATVFLTSSDLQPVAPTQIATLNAICFFFDRIKIFQASIPQAERISYTVLFHALPVTLLSEDYRGQ